MLDSRPPVLAVITLVLTLLSASRASADAVTVASPDGTVQFQLVGRDAADLNYRVSFRSKPVIETSRAGVKIDGVDLGQGVEFGPAETYRRSEKYPVLGLHAEAFDHCNGARVALRHLKSGVRYTLDVRAFNDGVAFRFIVPGNGSPRVADAATAFVLPAGSVVWYHDLEGHYEGVHTRKAIGEVKAGEWAAPPLTVQLPAGLGYAAITEGALIDFAGMVLQADGRHGFEARLGHAAPPCYPFRLRYAADVQRIARPAPISGTITTPWRVVMAGADLNTLVNCDIVRHVSPPPNPKLFPKGLHTSWIKPGRCVWKYLDGGASTFECAKEFSRLAAELGFEYNLVEGYWQKWSEEQLRELVVYSKERGVGIFLWKHSKDIRDPEARRRFFQRCQAAGVAGVKLDFFDHEAKEVVDHYRAALHDAAECRLLVDFHGANKPAGEARTWPNELTREGIYGLEHKKMAAWARHNTTLPFTRMLAGHADYTPVIFGERRRETSWAHQVATAAVLTSPLLVYGAHPKSMLDNPAAPLLKSIPSVWDETVALPGCAIGELAVFARRSGRTWFLAALNGPEARTVKVPLSFLGPQQYRALLVRDDSADAAAVKTENAHAARGDTLTLELRAGGGFIGRFVPLQK
jgi:alpha-glucosidase